MKDDFTPARRAGQSFLPVQSEPETKTLPNINDDPAAATQVHQAPGSELPPPRPHLPAEKPRPKGRGPKAWWRKFRGLSRNKKIIVLSALAGILIAIGGLVWYFVLRSEPAPPPPPPIVKKEEPKPTTVPSPLTGVQVKPELAALPTTGVMLENSPDARPQSGLYNAGVVFEAIAEGGITRFLVLYQEAKPEYIGPVRSVRPYYLDFLAPFDAPIAHAGGSGQALSELRSQGLKDLEAFQSPNYYQRISNRYAPHNLYTGRSKLLELQKAKGWTKSTFTGFARKEEKKVTRTKIGKIDFSISGFLYNAHFDYDLKTNSYKRSLAGKPHTDEKARRQINPKTVVGLVMSHRYAGVYSVYGARGKGSAFFFQDGTLAKGTWEKKNRTSQFKFLDSKGETVKLNPGQTWVTIVGSAGAVSYKP
ncbi:MAG TPA: DUF3048 domain-containing protein [Candidatus Limnocylindria bacterium]|nr:DUF3048 domain-containing protein [Candidatus Limnocylindria bacterium]